MLPREPAIPSPRAHGAEALRGDDEVVPPSVEPAAEDLFGAADGVEAATLRINVGRVEKRNTAGGGFVQNRAGRRLVTLQAERHGAEAQTGDVESSASQPDVPHAVVMPSLRRARDA